jgi:integrase
MNAPASTTEATYYNGGIIRVAPSGRYQAEYTRNYKRRRKSFDTIEKCERWINAAAKAVERSGTDALSLSSAELGDASRALQASGRRVTLSEAVEFWLHHHPEAGNQTTVREFYEAVYLPQMRDVKRCSPDHMKNVRRYCEMLIQKHGEVPLAGVSADQLQAILDTMTKVKSVTRKKARDTWRAMFNAAIDRKLATANPAKGLMSDFVTRTPSRMQKLDNKSTIGILTADDARKLFVWMEANIPEMVVGLVLQFFAGLRLEEVPRLSWSMIDLEGAEIHLPAEVAKTAQSRIIPLEPNAVEWLFKHPVKRSGRVLTAGDTDYRRKRRFERARDKACEGAGIVWVQNAGRHGFGSYHSRLKSSEHETFSAMGHEDLKTFRKHYKNTNITQAECKAYWAIRPSGASESIPFEEASA